MLGSLAEKLCNQKDNWGQLPDPSQDTLKSGVLFSVPKEVVAGKWTWRPSSGCLDNLEDKQNTSIVVQESGTVQWRDDPWLKGTSKHTQKDPGLLVTVTPTVCTFTVALKVVPSKNITINFIPTAWTDVVTTFNILHKSQSVRCGSLTLLLVYYILLSNF